MVVVVPGDAQEIIEATEAVIGHKGPVYLRLGRDEDLHFLGSGSAFRLGRAVTVKDGCDVTIFSNGGVTPEALAAAYASSVSAKVVHMPTVKPLDREAVVAAARDTGAVVCVEEHSVIGGLGGAVAELLAEEYPVPIKRIGIGDTFGESGNHRELLIKHGLTAKNIGTAIEEIQRRRVQK
jgi:transketolase